MKSSKQINRREFLSNTAKAVVAASSLPLYSFADHKAPLSPARTKLALV